jgi:RNA polymerase-binding transcription factor DksA
MQNTVNRYSDAELEEFKQLIMSKLERAKEQLEDLQGQLFDFMDSNEEDFGSDYIDDSSTGTQLELLNDMAIRQRKYIKDLENALVRIRNKSYGICVITGELIDKKRLLAVPTTTKSLQAKVQPSTSVKPLRKVEEEEEEEESEEGTTPKRKPEPKPKIITKVIRKPKPGAAQPVEEDEDLLEPLPTWEDDDEDPITYVDDMDNFLDDGEEGDDF